MGGKPEIAMTRIFRIGLLGASKIAPTAVIAPAAKHAGFTVTAVAARDPARARAYAAEHGIAGVAPDYAALVARDDVDLVYNALPPVGHAPWTIAALEAGKAVLCEKPFALDADEARAMTTAAERAGRPLLEAFHYRFHPVLLSAFAFVGTGALGRLIEAEADFETPIPEVPGELRWLADQGGGALMDLGCYCVHALRTIAGEEPAVSSARARVLRGVDAETEATLKFPSGFTGRVRCSMTPERFRAQLRVHGDRGWLRIKNFIAPQIGCRFTTFIDGREEIRPVDGPSTFEAQMQHVVDVLSHAVRPLTGGPDSVANMAVMDMIKQSSGRG
jgi:predicted dehydrogenase